MNHGSMKRNQIIEVNFLDVVALAAIPGLNTLVSEQQVEIDAPPGNHPNLRRAVDGVRGRCYRRDGQPDRNDTHHMSREHRRCWML
jgi:hypothetical protein